jgi:hypothetical protein
MKIRTISLATLLPLILVVAGCASGQPYRGQGLAAEAKLEATKEGHAEYVYKAKDVDWKQYSRFLIPRAAIYSGSDAQFGGATNEQKQEVADFLRNEFAKVLDQGGYPIVTQPGPAVAELKLTLAGLALTHPFAATISHLAPAGIVMNIGKGVAGGGGTFMGSVTFAGEVYDSQSGKLLAAFVTRQNAGAMNVPAAMSELGSAKVGVTKGAKDFLAAVRRVEK